MKHRGRCSSTDPASLPDDLFHQVLDAVYRSGDTAFEMSKPSYRVGGTNFMIALVSKRWHLGSLRALTVARVTPEYQDEANLLKQLARFKTLTKIALHEKAVRFLSPEFLRAASENWPGLKTLVLRDVRTNFYCLEPAGAQLRSLTSVVIGQPLQLYDLDEDAIFCWTSSLENLTNLELLKCSIKRLPADFGSRFLTLRRLRLSHMQGLTRLPESIGDLVGLKELILDNCNVAVLPPALSRLSALRSLKWRHKKIRDLTVIASLRGVQHLKLNTQRLEDIAPAGLFAGLELLQVLKLSSSPSRSPPSSPALQSLIHCQGLRVLDIIGCEGLLQDFGWLGSLTALQNIKVSTIRMPDLPANLGTLKDLERVCLCGGLVKTLPRTFGDLASLRYLRIDSLELEEWPDSLASLSQLTDLSLSGSADSILSMELGTITSLQTLRISGCCFAGIPKDLGLLPKLTSLRIYCRPCNSLLPRGFPSLQELHILGCFRPVVPKLVLKSEDAQLTVEDYPCLKRLRIVSWEAESLPNALGHLHHLEELHLYSGDFTKLPETMSSLSSLKELHLHSCRKLMNLPATIGTISSLAMLCLDKCDRIDPESLTGYLKAVKRSCRKLTVSWSC